MSVHVQFDKQHKRARSPLHQERETVEVRTAQAARDMAKNRALPISNGEREDLKRLADHMEDKGLEY
jgi:hypothetical protein